MLANKRYYRYMCFGIVAYGGLIELGQSYIPGREMSAFDLLANILGVALGALVVNRRR
jgi:VanZ family protein